MNVEFGGLLPPVEDLHQKALCFATKGATWTLFVMQKINGKELSISELDLPRCSFGRLDNYFCVQ